jgi:anti-sigma factor RsiW
MRQSRFEWLLESYGAALERWPEAEREAARRLLGTSPAARAAHERARALDVALAADRVAIDAATLERMRATIRERVARTPIAPAPAASWWAGLLRAPAVRFAALAAAALASVWIGWASASSPRPNLYAVLEGNPLIGGRQ